MRQPIKRHRAIKPVSREHHHGLLVGWKIRMGLRKEISPDRIKKYLNWYYTYHQIPHFRLEEEYLFPILGSGHEHVRTALDQHRQIHHFFGSETASTEELAAFEELLSKHIRFEERILFNSIQESSHPDSLQLLEDHLHDHGFEENTEDEFWL